MCFLSLVIIFFEDGIVWMEKFILYLPYSVLVSRVGIFKL